MIRRDFLAGVLSAPALLNAPSVALSETAKTVAKKARIISNQVVNVGHSYNHRKMADPTGSAPTRQIERFELRGGDCLGKGDAVSDCTARGLNGRMVTRARTERVIVADLQDGDEGLVSYYLYIPRSEYNFTEHFGSTMGQVISRLSKDRDSDGFPIFSLNTDEERGSTGILAVLDPARDFESQEVREKQFPIGRVGSDAFLKDRWFNIKVRFKLSSSSDGSIQCYVNDKKVGQFVGRTIVPSGCLEFRYGIYQTGTNHYPGGAGAVPTQVAYYSDAKVLRIT